MAMESHIVLRNDQVESLGWLFNFNKLEDLHVVFEDFACESVRSNIDNVDVWVFNREYSGDLGVLFLL